MSYVAKESHILKKQYVIDKYNKEKEKIKEDVKDYEKDVLSQIDPSDDRRDVIAKQIAVDSVLPMYLQSFKEDSFGYCREVLEKKYGVDVDFKGGATIWNVGSVDMDIDSARDYLEMVKKKYMVLEDSRIEKGKISRKIQIYDKEKQVPVLRTIRLENIAIGGLDMQPSPLIMFLEEDGNSEVHFSDALVSENERNAILMDSFVEKLFHIQPPDDIYEIKGSHRKLLEKVNGWKPKIEELLF